MNINEVICMALNVSEESKVPMLFMGNPGVGKTTSIESYAKLKGMRMVLLRGSQASAEEILGYEVNDGELIEINNVRIKKSNKICPEWYVTLMNNSSEGVKTILFLDEITTSNMFVQSALLQVILGRSIDDFHKIPDDTLIVAAGNYSGNLSSEFNLLPPLMNRFCIINLSVTKDDVKLFLSKYNSSSNGVIDNMRRLENIKSDHKFTENEIDIINNLIETEIQLATLLLIDNNKLDLNCKEMSDLYQGSVNNEIPGFVTLRSLNYLRDVSISTYLNYGSIGINSNSFSNIVQGLVGVSLSHSSNGDIVKTNSHSTYLNILKNLAKKLDSKIKDKSSSTLNSIISDVIKNPIDSKSCLGASSALDTALKSSKVISETPIEEATLDELLEKASMYVKSEIDNICEIGSKLPDDTKSIDMKVTLVSINSGLTNVSSGIKLYKSVESFVSNTKFKYRGDFMNPYSAIFKKSMYKLNFSMKNSFKKKLGDLFTDLIKLPGI